MKECKMEELNFNKLKIIKLQKSKEANIKLEFFD